MAFTPVAFDRFNGLNLAVDPAEAGTSAIDLLNVDFSTSGVIRTRPGTQVVKSYTPPIGGLASYEAIASGLKHLIVGYGNVGSATYQAINPTTGAVIASSLILQGTPAVSAIRFGTLGAEYLYIANGADSIWRWDGAAFTKPAGVVWGYMYLGRTAASNRLVAAQSVDAPSRVMFSDPGAAESWPVDNYLDLAPGDGSPIIGLASFRQYLFAFKRDRFFVFYGESIDSLGKPLFNYRTVEGFGAIIPPATGEEGVYFYDGRSIWVTTGDIPTRISAPVEPYLQARQAVNGWTVDSTQNADGRLFYSLGRLYVSLYTNLAGAPNGHRPLVFDARTGQWTLWHTGVLWMTTMRAQNTAKQYTYFMDNGAVRVYDDQLTTDIGSGVDIAWTWQSGYSDFGVADVKKARQVRLWGSGAPQVNMFTDYGIRTTLPQAVTLGVGGIAEGRYMQACEGSLMSYRLSGSSFGQINRVVVDLDGQRTPGAKS